MTPIHIFEEFKREGEIWHKIVQHEPFKCSCGEWYESVFGIECHVRSSNYTDNPNFEEPTWKDTGWLLERMTEWEELKKFCEYHGFSCVESIDIEKPIWYFIPLDWLTSPTILPEKIGEYIKWRDEK